MVGDMQTKLPVGVEVAGYRIESFVARGGMAEVYRARDLQLDRQVALKLLAPELAESESFRARFLRESRLAASIDHPHIIPIFAAGMADDLLYLAMRYVQGADLKALLAREGPLALDRAHLLLSQVGQALDAAHARDLVHRDVKPANVLVGAPGRDGVEHVYLSDFGLTKRSTSMSGLTAAGFVAGTIDYIAPEQISAKPVDPRADVYALGCVLYEALTGQVPYPRDHDAAVLYAHMFDPPPAVTALRPDLPEQVDAVLATAMAKHADDRYGSGRELFADLAQLQVAFAPVRSAERALSGPPLSDHAAHPAGPPSEPHTVSPAPPAVVSTPAPPLDDDGAWVVAGTPLRRPVRRARYALTAVTMLVVLTLGGFLAVQRWALPEPEPRVLVSRTEFDGTPVERTWRLGGRNGDRLEAELVVLSSRSGRDRTVEVLPAGMVPDPGRLHHAGLTLATTPNGDPVLRADLTSGQRATFRYMLEVPAGPVTDARLQELAKQAEEAAADAGGRVVRISRRPSGGQQAAVSAGGR
jgi:tRNA A-37 threonylcarbamoyl transferase component Bud32